MSLQTTVYYVAAVVVGMLGGIHVPIAGAMGVRINSALVATFTFYGIAFGLISLACLVTWDRAAFVALRTVSPWYYLAGVISVVVVGTNTFLIPRLGAVVMFVIMLAAQLLVRMVISHYGLLDSPVSPISAYKVVGAVLFLAGAVLVVRY